MEEMLIGQSADEPSARASRIASQASVRHSSEWDRHWSLKPLAALNRVFAHAYHRLEVLGPCQIPSSGPAILACNHTASADPIWLQATCPRPIVWLMASEFMSMRHVRWLFDLIEVIAVTRGARDVKATRAVLDALGRGRVVGIFPEARIERRRELFPFEPGVALLAKRSRAGVWPAWLDGTQRNSSLPGAFLLPREVTIRHGPRVSLAGDVQDDTRRLFNAVQQLMHPTLPP
jgi:1-acyl-sn-glycerol-3-phosphate acyltransferase